MEETPMHCKRKSGKDSHLFMVFFYFSIGYASSQAGMEAVKHRLPDELLLELHLAVGLEANDAAHEVL